MFALALVLAVVAGVALASAQAWSVPLARTLGLDQNAGLKALTNLTVTRASLGGAQDAGVISGHPVNILVLGVDAKPDDGSGSTIRRSDTMMLVQVSPRNGTIKLLSIPRDLMVQVEPGVEGKINSAYAYGGISQTVSAVKNYADIPIDHYAVVDFEGFESVIDEIGGVKIDAQDGFPSNMHIEPGLQHFNGHRALLYARYRGTPGADLDRIKRQQQLVAALRSKALRWDSVKRLPAVAATIEEHVTTDLGIREGVTLGRVLLKHGRGARMTATQLKGTPETLPDGEEVLRPDQQANQALLREFRY